MMKRWNIMGMLAAALTAILLCAPCAQATDQETAAYYKDVEVKVGVITAEAKVNMRREPNTKAGILARIQPGETVDVLDDSDEDWLKVKYDGEVGYVSADFVEVSTYMDQQPVIIEDPIEVTVTDLSLPTILAHKESFTIEGTLTSNNPIIGVSIEVKDNRSLETVMSASKSFEYEEDVHTFDINTFDRDLVFRKLAGGEKTLTVTVSSSAETQTVVTQDFYVKGDLSTIASMTDDCEIDVTTGKKAYLTDGSVRTHWTAGSEADRITVTVPSDKNAALLTLAWSQAPSAFTVTLQNATGDVIDTITETNPGEMMNFAYDLDTATKKIFISTSDTTAGICELRVMEEGRISETVQRWQPIEGKVDLLVISTHEDDELLFFGGTIPYYVAQGKNVVVVYMANCGRFRYEEAMEGLWSCGLKNHPVFVGLEDKRLNDYDETVNLWGLEATEQIVTELLRKYQPDVVVTHDINGEYGHNQHKLTSAVVRRAVYLAADAESYPESAAEYGTWEIKKLYIHLYEGNQLTMTAYDESLEELGGLTATQVATIAYSKHVSQQKYYSMEKQGVQYDNRKYGLILTNVGDDVAKNDLFENVGSVVTVDSGADGEPLRGADDTDADDAVDTGAEGDGGAQ